MSSTDVGLTVKMARSFSVGKVRLSRGGCGMVKPPGWSIFSS